MLSLLRRYEEAEEAQERIAQLEEEGYGDEDDDDYIGLIVWADERIEGTK